MKKILISAAVVFCALSGSLMASDHVSLCPTLDMLKTQSIDSRDRRSNKTLTIDGVVWAVTARIRPDNLDSVNSRKGTFGEFKGEKLTQETLYCHYGFMIKGVDVGWVSLVRPNPEAQKK